jgi:transcriptional regulator with XRE-family HTH domain
MDMRPIEDAAGRGDYAVVLRLGRIARGWTQAELARRANISRTVVSRFETGDRQLRDVGVRLLLAEVLGLPVGWFGLVRPSGPIVGDTAPSRGDDVRRRAFLIAAGAAAVVPGGQASAEVDPARALTRRVEQVLIHPERGQVLDPKALAAMLRAARTDYRDTRYLSMADRLADLVASAEAYGDQRLLADIYQAIANLLCKLPASELEWVAVDRAGRAARQTGEPILVAESQRLLSIAYRRAGRAGRRSVLGSRRLSSCGGMDRDTRCGRPRYCAAPRIVRRRLGIASGPWSCSGRRGRWRGGRGWWGAVDGVRGAGQCECVCRVGGDGVGGSGDGVRGDAGGQAARVGQYGAAVPVLG